MIRTEARTVLQRREGGTALKSPSTFGSLPAQWLQPTFFAPRDLRDLLPCYHLVVR